MNLDKVKTKSSKIKSIIAIIILLVFVYFAYKYYQENNFNDFIRSESNLHSSEFKRDSKEKYLDKASYRIYSKEYNDAMFYKTIEVEKNQSYKVSCMVKTENVQPSENKSGIGAGISIEGATERSVAITRNF